jgi:hypothetical protein
MESIVGNQLTRHVLLFTHRVHADNSVLKQYMHKWLSPVFIHTCKYKCMSGARLQVMKTATL